VASRQKKEGKIHSKINCELGFKRSGEALAVPDNKPGNETRIDLISMQDWYKIIIDYLQKKEYNLWKRRMENGKYKFNSFRHISG
jgi:hypothetical protein